MGIVAGAAGLSAAFTGCATIAAAITNVERLTAAAMVFSMHGTSGKKLDYIGGCVQLTYARSPCEVPFQAGSCWVMQCNAPRPQMKSPQWMPTTLRVGN